MMNRSACRLKDIKNILLDTGIGVSAYSVMEQGRIDSILQANPVDRRAIFEEAAGISRFKARRKEAERKLERTNSNLLRVGDIVEELEKRIRSLKNQAGRARSYLKNSEKLKNLKKEHFAHLYKILVDEGRLIQENKSEASRKLDEAAKVLAEMKERLSILERETEIFNEELSLNKTNLAEVKTSLEDSQEKIGYLERRQGELENEATELEVREGEVSSSLKEKESARDEIKKRHMDIAKEEDDLAIEEKDSKSLLNETETVWNNAISNLESLNIEALEVNRTDVDLKNKAVEAEARYKGIQNSLIRMAWRQNGLAEEIEEVGVLLKRTEVNLKERETSRAKLTIHLKNGQDKEQLLQERLQSIDNNLNSVASEIIKRESRIDLLKNLIERREGVGKGVKAVLDEASVDGTEFNFVRGMLGELLEVDIKDSKSLETALGAIAEAVVVDSLPQAQMVIDFVKKTNNGKTCLLVLDHFRNSTAISSESNSIQMNVKFRSPEIRQAIDAVLGSTRIIEQDQLTDSGKDSQYRYITPEGDMFDNGVLYSGGPIKTSGVIARISELAALENESKDLNERKENLQKQRKSAATELEAMSLENKGLAEKIEADSEAVAQFNAEKESRLERWRRIRREFNMNSIESFEFEKNSISLKDELRDLRKEMSSIKSKLTELEESVRNARLNVEYHQDEREKAAEKMRRLEMLRLQFKERRDGIETERRIVEQNVKEAVIRLDDIKRDRLRVSRVLVEMAEQLDSSRKRTENLLVRRSDLSNKVQEMTVAAEERKSVFESNREDLALYENHQEEARSKLDNLRIDERENEVKLASLIEKAIEEIDLDLYAAFEEKEDVSEDEKEDRPDHDWEAIEEEIKTIRDRLSRMGNVNLDAISELDEVETRYNGLIEQSEDLVKSIKSLEEMIKDLNRESREKFIVTFEEVKTHFHAIFRKLFQGGKADLRLRDDGDVLESGIDILAGPPGKDMRSINLLSGGERTLTAVGLLFALFKTRPSPFCILDEVDAALDEVNIERFCILLGSYVNESQFIIVTHSKRTMSYCDFLYGITMQENGVSTKISLNLQAYEDQVA